MQPPYLTLPILRWERRGLQERDEDFALVFTEANEPVYLDERVELYLQTPGGVEIRLEVDRAPFDKYLLPRLLEPSIAFWRAVLPGHPLFIRKVTMLDALLEEKKRFESVR